MELDFLEIFTLMTGVLFLILEIRQSDWMWLFQLLSAAAAMVSFFIGGLYASSVLNLYYVVMAFVGFAQWRRDERASLSGRRDGRGADCSEGRTGKDGRGGNGGGVQDVSENPTSGIRLRRLPFTTVLASLAVLIAGTAALFFLLRRLGNPKSVADAGAAVLSAIATWWLAKSYPQQWLLWVVADAVSAWLCWTQGMGAMTVLYVIYAFSAIYGYVHWTRKGGYIDDVG